IKSRHLMQITPYIAPPFLKKDDLVGVTCPASKIAYEKAKYGCEVIRSWGYQVKMGRTLKGHFHNFSAPDEQRLDELQQMLDDRAMKAIVFGRGGYGVLRILDRLDFTRFQKHPKWICGYSDITALHAHVLRHCGIQTIHSVMCNGITEDTYSGKYVNSLKETLSGQAIHYTFESRPLNRPGRAKGVLVGGNLCLLAAICGSVSQPDMEGKILFIEEIGEYKYSIDRMMITLQRAGWLDRLAGLIVGGFTDSKDTEEPFGQT